MTKQYEGLITGDVETGNLEVSGIGELKIVNTGGSSAGEGGMGSGDDSDGKEKGEISKPGESQQQGGKQSSESQSTGDAYQDKVKEETEKASKRSV